MKIILIICFFIGALNYAQISYQKFYAEFGGSATPIFVKNIPEGNLIAYTKYENVETNLYLLKVGHNGKFINNRKFNGRIKSFIGGYPIDINSANEVILLEQLEEADSTKFFVSKFDPSFQSLWKFELTDIKFNSRVTLNFTQNNEILLSHTSATEFSKTNFIQLDSNGKVNWFNSFSLSTISFSNSKITEDEDGSYYYERRGMILKINKNGDSLWNKKISDFTSISHILSGFSDRIVIVYNQSPGNSFIIIDKDGLILEQFEFFDRTKDISFQNSEELLILDSHSRLHKLNLEGRLLWSSSQYSNLFIPILITEENSYKNILIAGTFSLLHEKGLFLIKTGVNGNLEKQIEIINQPSSRTYSINESISISWLSYDVEKLDIQYKEKHSDEWIDIVTDYSAIDSYYYWELPNYYVLDAKIRLVDSNDPDIYAITSSEISVEEYNSVDTISANNCKMWIKNDGSGARHPETESYGFYWTGEDDYIHKLVYNDGLFWTGLVNGSVILNGYYRNINLLPGPIDENGNPVGEIGAGSKIYMLKKDWDEETSPGLKSRLLYDYYEWPAEHGAPYIDINKDGIFTRNIDEPKFLGDETFHYTANDLKQSYSSNSSRIGIEYQRTVFASGSPKLEDAVVQIYRLINKSNKTVNEMYLGYQVDDDLGFITDDYVGIDTINNMTYTYNSVDEDYLSNNISPAVGRIVLQGPIVYSEGDDGIINNHIRNNSTNLPITSFVPYINGSSIYSSPESYYSSTNLFQIYNNCRGLSIKGQAFTDPGTGEETNICLAGDPINKTGWYEGDGWADEPNPGDRKYLMSMGPFTFAPQDTQEVVIATVVAQGSDRLNSLQLLKQKAVELHEWYRNDFITDVKDVAAHNQLPTAYSLSQNYPNPFNPTTTIEYSIPSSVMLNSFQHQDTEIRQLTDDFAKVRLVIYDILGREVATLVNEQQKPGSYKVKWDACKYSSGVYFYELRTNDYSQIRKMILIK